MMSSESDQSYPSFLERHPHIPEHQTQEEYQHGTETQDARHRRRGENKRAHNDKKVRDFVEAGREDLERLTGKVRHRVFVLYPGLFEKVEGRWVRQAAPAAQEASLGNLVISPPD